MVSHYPQGPMRRQPRRPSGFLAKVTQLIRTWTGKEAETTELGSPATASPSVYAMSLHSLRYERRQMIADCRQMIVDDPRARRSTQKFAREAVRRGVVITMQPIVPQMEAEGKQIPPELEQAQADLARIQAIVNKKAFSWAWMLLVEGDLFIQAIIDEKTKQIVDLKRMPAASMERNTDDADEFVDPMEAYSQVDVLTNEEVANFPEGVIYHARWNHIDGERYGEPEVVAGRRLRRLLEVMEEAQAVRRMTRAAQKRLWNIGSMEFPGTEQEVQEFKEANGFIEGTQEIFDPSNVAVDYFSNGLVSVNVVPDDPGMAQIGDLNYFQNLYTSAVLPTPAPLYNLASDFVNRDVLEDLRAEWLRETQVLTDMMEEVVRWACDLQLLLRGLLPEEVPYTCRFSESVTQSPAEVMDMIRAARSGLMGQFPDPLLSRTRAVQMLAEHFDVQDVAAEVEAIDNDILVQQQRYVEFLHAQQAVFGEMGFAEKERREAGDPGDRPENITKVAQLRRHEQEVQAKEKREASGDDAASRAAMRILESSSGTGIEPDDMKIIRKALVGPLTGKPNGNRRGRK